MFKCLQVRRSRCGLILGLALAAVAFNDAACAAAGQGVLSVFRCGVRDKAEVALTFDDGPHPLYTQLILNILRSYGAKATFFVVGKRVEQFPQLLEKITEQDHELGNHSYSHPDMKTLNSKQIREELNKTYKLVRVWSGEKLVYFRPPGGQYNRLVQDCSEALGYRMILWDVNPADWKYSSEKILEKTKNVRAGDVILLHDGALATVKALPVLLQQLQEKGLRCVTISKMLGRLEEKRERRKKDRQLAVFKQLAKDYLKEGPHRKEAPHADKGLMLYESINKVQ